MTAVYRRTYSQQDLKAFDAKADKAYRKKFPKFEKAFRKKWKADGALRDSYVLPDETAFSVELRRWELGANY